MGDSEEAVSLKHSLWLLPAATLRSLTVDYRLLFTLCPPDSRGRRGLLRLMSFPLCSQENVMDPFLTRLLLQDRDGGVQIRRSSHALPFVLFVCKVLHMCGARMCVHVCGRCTYVYACMYVGVRG